MLVCKSAAFEPTQDHVKVCKAAQRITGTSKAWELQFPTGGEGHPLQDAFKERERDEEGRGQRKRKKDWEGGLREGERRGAANYHWGETGALLETGVGVSVGGDGWGSPLQGVRLGAPSLTPSWSCKHRGSDKGTPRHHPKTCLAPLFLSVLFLMSCLV